MKRPDLRQLADFPEVVAAIGVVVSLLYVATELHQKLDPDLWKGYDRMIRGVLQNPALRDWYAAHQDEYSDGFRA